MSTNTEPVLDLNAFGQEVSESASNYADISREVSSHPDYTPDKIALLIASRDSFYEATFEITLAAIRKVLGNAALVRKVIATAHDKVADNLYHGASNIPAIWKEELAVRIALLIPVSQKA